MKKIIINGRIITPYRLIEHSSIVIDDDKIVDIAPNDRLIYDDSAQVIDAQGNYVSPGFIDTHTHGAGGFDFMDGTIDAVIAACQKHMSFGTTSIVPTTLSSDKNELFENLRNIERASQMTANMPNIIGIHLEGPYCSFQQSGAQDKKYIRDPDPEEYLELINTFKSIKKWTIAPELPGALEMGRKLSERGIVASIGHSDGVHEDVVAAIENGFTMVTHLFNAMSRITRKNTFIELGIAESTLLNDSLIAEVIADGKHVPVPLLKLIYKSKGAEKICLVTDSIRAAGIDVTESIIGSKTKGQRVLVEDGVAFMPNRQSFGGSVATSNRLVRTMYKDLGLPIEKAIEMITLTPAKTLGIDLFKGTLCIGKHADIVIFDENINIKFVMVMGNIWINQTDQQR